MKVWLDRTEVELLLDEAQDTEQKVAFGLAVRCGLRRSSPAVQRKAVAKVSWLGSGLEESRQTASGSRDPALRFDRMRQ